MKSQISSKDLFSSKSLSYYTTMLCKNNNLLLLLKFETIHTYIEEFQYFFFLSLRLLWEC